MSPQDKIHLLRDLLAKCYNEQTLLDSVRQTIPGLREVYKKDRSRISSEDVTFLALVKQAELHLGRFIEIQEEIESVHSIEEYDELEEELRSLQKALAPFRVCERVAKEQRELQARRPFVLQRDLERRTSRYQRILDDMAERSPKCPQGHSMVIRSSVGANEFWGCSRFPFCRATKKLGEAELAELRNAMQ